MSLGGSGGERSRNYDAIALLALLLSFSAISFFSLVQRPIACFPGDIGTIKCPLVSGTHDATSLGVWRNMPSAATELMGNTTYRSLIIPSNGILPNTQVVLEVNCITISNTVGAVLALQEATYDLATQTNVTNFVAISTGVIVYIDGGMTDPTHTCVNNGIGTSISASPTVPASNQGWEFRVVGSGGGGVGDNPRFASITIAVFTSVGRVFSGRTSVGPTTTGFTAQIFANLPETVSTTATFNWLATNETTTSCGAGDHCLESGSSSCTISVSGSVCTQAITFTTAFSVAPKTFVSPTNAFSAVQLVVGTVNLLMAQTLTV